MRVAMDLAQLELVLGLFCRGDVSSLGHPYKMLRALRLLLRHVDDSMVFGRRYCFIYVHTKLLLYDARRYIYLSIVDDYCS